MLERVPQRGLIMGGAPFTVGDTDGGRIDGVPLKHLVACGAVRHMIHGVYVDAVVPDAIEVRAAGVALVLPTGAALCRLSAAWLHGIDARSPADSVKPVPLQVVRDRSSGPVDRNGVVGLVADLRPTEIDVVDGIPVTTPTRTAVDMLRWMSPPVGLAAADQLARANLIDPAEVTVEVERWRGEKGVAKARYLVRLIEPASESPGESATRLRLIDAGLPRPEAQIVVCRGSIVRRLDLGWVVARKAVEYNGRMFHTTPEDVAYDAERYAWLVGDLGWEITVADRSSVWGPSMELEARVAQMLGVELKVTKRAW